ncbi:hypothetical protein COLO4_07147 [Corchorus olitorius]|uniref:RNase H type-1 domain-containing protein n=1 Tax=Corchorus olitorius TaxID=93759 RepID=A0A1R3KKS9_9ROSI|nr:hypothetical protein COLO4_07147 [Corchorus olitorius]
MKQPRRWKKAARVSEKYSSEVLAPQTNFKNGKKRVSTQEDFMSTEEGTAKKSREEEGPVADLLPTDSGRVADTGAEDFVVVESSEDSDESESYAVRTLSQLIKLCIKGIAETASENKCAGIGIVARNHSREVLYTKGEQVHCNSALMAETLAFKAAVDEVVAKNWNCVLFESDSVELVKNVQEKKSEQTYWKIQPVIKDIQENLSLIN